MFKKIKGDHSILAALLMMTVAVIVGIFVMSVIHTTGPNNADRLTERTSKTMHNDGNRIYEY